jgi:hypothetical protein
MLGVLLPLVAIAAEGAWITVVYVAVETVVDARQPLLGTFELSVPAAIAALATARRWLDPDEDPLTFLAIVVAVGAVGWLWDADARSALLDGDLVRAIGIHPGGWLALVALMRGVGRGSAIDDRAQTRLVMFGVPALAVPWLLGQAVSPELRTAFLREAFVASIAFLSAGFMAAGLARLQEIGRETGIDWRRDRSWLGMVVGVLLVVCAAGIPAAYLLGIPIEVIGRGLLGPIAGLLGYLIYGVAVVLGLLAQGVYTILSQLGVRLPPPVSPEIPGGGSLETYTFEQLRGPLLGVGLFWGLILLAALVVGITWLRRRSRPRVRRDDEERSIRFPQGSLRIPRPPRPVRSRRSIPTDAVGAYLAVLDLLDGGTDARAASETPRAHAHRTHRAVGGEITMLQADYALARYGHRRLTDAEGRRALGRWRRLRDRLG